MDTTKANTRITLECDAITALCVLGNIDLAQKHPLNTGPSKIFVGSFREQLLSKLAETGLLSPDELERIYSEEEVEVSRHEAQQRLREEWDL